MGEPAEPWHGRSSSYAAWRPLMAAAICKTTHARLGEKGQEGLMSAAVAAFQQEVPQGTEEHDLQYLARDTYSRLTTDGHLGDRAGGGADVKLSHADVAQARDIFLAGNGAKHPDEFWGYTSLPHTLSENTELQGILKRSRVPSKTLWRRIKHSYLLAHCEELKPIKITLKPALKEETRMQRLKAAEEWLAWGKEKLKNVVWIDEKQEYLRAGGSYWCYAPHGLPSCTRECHKPLRQVAQAQVRGCCLCTNWACLPQGSDRHNGEGDEVHGAHRSTSG